MSLIEWVDDLSVGNELIDDHHKKLVAIANRFHDAIMSESTQDVIDETFKELADYTQYHFSEEERLMEKNNDPTYANHKIAHMELLEQILDLDIRNSTYTGSPRVAQELGELLKDWVITHIIRFDKLSAPYFQPM
jgi:hemerythrin-like metal-binding protein